MGLISFSVASLICLCLLSRDGFVASQIIEMRVEEGGMVPVGWAVRFCGCTEHFQHAAQIHLQNLLRAVENNMEPVDRYLLRSFHTETHFPQNESAHSLAGDLGSVLQHLTCMKRTVHDMRQIQIRRLSLRNAINVLGDYLNSRLLREVLHDICRMKVTADAVAGIPESVAHCQYPQDGNSREANLHTNCSLWEDNRTKVLPLSYSILSKALNLMGYMARFCSTELPSDQTY